MGDATNTVIILAGELLKRAENLLIMGLHPSEITKGYELACAKALEELESIFVSPQSFSSCSHEIRAFDIFPSLTPHKRFARCSFETCYCVEAVRL
jgi:T-complex protein 1 subunit theta